MNKKKMTIVLGLAMGLPSTILGVSYLFWNLAQKDIISERTAVLLIVLSVINTFYIMIRYASKKT